MVLSVKELKTTMAMFSLFRAILIVQVSDLAVILSPNTFQTFK